MNPSELIDQRITELNDWRGEFISRLRKIIHEASPEIKEEWKWGSPVFTHNGLVCSLGSFSDHVKIHFFKGASLQDSKGLFNAGLEAKGTRGIDFFENDEIPAPELKDLIRSAIKHNTSK